MGDSQMEISLLRLCLAFPKVSFVLRTCPLSHISQGVGEFDSAVCDVLYIGGPLSNWSWLKASLPSSHGGLNLRRASLHAPTAFLASSLQSLQLIQRVLRHPPGPSPHASSAVASLAVAAARPDWSNLDDIDVPLRQLSLSHAIDEASHQHLLSSAPDTLSRALALSSGLPHADDWLNIIPSAPLGLHLLDREFRSCLRYWLGVPLHSGTYTCPECLGSADPFGDHQVGCAGIGDRIARHNAIRDVLFNAAQSACAALALVYRAS